MKPLLGDRSTPALPPATTGPQFPFISAPRMSILPSVRIPLLRRSEAEEPPPHSKPPLLTMKIASSSFLDVSVVDDDSQLELYSIGTNSTTTTLTRSDNSGRNIRAALIKWPQVLPTKLGKELTDGVLVQLRHSKWTTRDALLSPPTSPSAPRKFKIPGYSQSMKWKRYGDTYWCTTSAVKGPIAVMERPGRSQPTKITLYETLFDKHDPKALSAIQGVSVLLLDYVLVTALLLVTDLQEWMLVQKLSGPDAVDPPALSACSSFTLASTPSQRRNQSGSKFSNSSAAEARSKHSSSSTGPMTPGYPRTPTSVKIESSIYNYDDSSYTSSRPTSPKPGLPSIVDSIDDSMDRGSFIIPDIQPSTPLAESLRYSSRHPSHSHFDPLFYGSSSHIPPVPSLRLSRQTNVSASKPPRESTEPPTPPFQSHGQEQTKIFANDNSERSVPLSVENVTGVGHHAASPEATGGVRPERSNSVRSHRSAGGRRPLPKLPPIPPPNSTPAVVRRAQSSTQLRNNATIGLSSPSSPVSPRPQRALPRTPSIIISNDAAPSNSSNSETFPLRSPHAVEQVHSRVPPISKTSQEDLTNWVHLLINPQRDLPPAPLPSSSIFDVPPPAYDTINFSPPKSQ